MTSFQNTRSRWSISPVKAISNTSHGGAMPRAELAAEALGQAGLTEEVVAVTLRPGRVRDELVATLMPTTGGPEVSRVAPAAALLDIASQEPQLCALARERYADSLHQALGSVVEQAVLRGSFPRKGWVLRVGPRWRSHR